MPAGLRTSQGHEATHLMMASLSIFTMQYGSLLPVLEGHGTALSAPPATALAPQPSPMGLSWSWVTKTFSPGKPISQVPPVGTPGAMGCWGAEAAPEAKEFGGWI